MFSKYCQFMEANVIVPGRFMYFNAEFVRKISHIEIYVGSQIPKYIIYIFIK